MAPGKATASKWFKLNTESYFSDWVLWLFVPRYILFLFLLELDFKCRAFTYSRVLLKGLNIVFLPLLFIFEADANKRLSVLNNVWINMNSHWLWAERDIFAHLKMGLFSFLSPDRWFISFQIPCFIIFHRKGNSKRS